MQQKSRVYPPLFRCNYFQKESTLFENPALFQEYRTVSKERVDSQKGRLGIGTTGIFHLIILNTLLQEAVRRMETTLNRAHSDVEQFRRLAERANRLVIQKMKEEEQWDNVPDEFEVRISLLFVYVFIQLLVFLSLGETVSK